MVDNKIKFIDLFAGIGGFHLAIEKFVKDYNKINQSKLKEKCILVSEISPKSIEVYKNNFNYKKDIKNIRDIDEKTIDDFDILCAGFPCQAFSGAGKKEGFKDKTRGTLFFDILRIIKHKKPKFLLLENVKHLTRHDQGKTWKVIFGSLINNGYITTKEPLVLSPHHFGVPQIRERVFIPCIRKDLLPKNLKHINLNLDQYKKEKCNPWKIVSKNNVDSKYFLDKYILNALNAWEEFLQNIKFINNRTLPVIWIDELNDLPIPKNISKWRNKYLQDMRLIYQLNKDFINKWKIKYKVDKFKKREKKFEWQSGRQIKSIKDSFIQLRQSGIRCKKPNFFPTLVAMVQVSIIFDKKINTFRYLTPKEVSYLQSFPKKFKIATNDYDAYRQFGNAINVDVAFYVLKELLNYG